MLSWVRGVVAGALVTLAAGQAGAAAKVGVPEPVAPRTPAVQAPAQPPLPARQDWWAAGGITLFPTGSVVGYRVEAGKPWPLQGLPGLRFLMVLYFNHWSASASVPGVSIDISASTLALFPSAQYDVPLADTPAGRISILPEVGLGPAVAWIKMPDMPFTPGHYETQYATVARLAGSLQFAMNNGVLVVVQPVAAYIGLQSGNLDSNLEIGVRVGYQLP